MRDKEKDLIKVLIADDSSFMRKTLTYILESDSSIRVIGTPSDGEDALRKTKELHLWQNIRCR